MAGMPTPITIAHGSTAECLLFAAEANRIGGDTEMDEWVTLHAPDFMAVNTADIGTLDRDPHDAATVRTAIEQNGFGDAVARIVNVCHGYDPHDFRNGASGYKWCITSETGSHDADVITHVAESYLNMLHDDDGHRLFNAKGFTFHGVPGRRAFVGQSMSCMQWEMHPDTAIEPHHGECPMSCIFGYAAAIVSPTAAENFEFLYNAIAADYHIGQPVVDHRNRADAAHADAGPSRSSMKRKRSPADAGPRPPPGLPPSFTAAPWHDHADARDVPITNTPLVGTARDHTWATTDSNIEVWWGVLLNAGVDQPAVQALFNLAQLSTDGYRAANNIVNALLKQESDARWCLKPSAWVHSSVQKARHKLMPKDW